MGVRIGVTTEGTFLCRVALIVVAAAGGAAAASDGLEGLREHLAKPFAERGDLAAADFADRPLSREEAEAAVELLWVDHASRLKQDRATEHAKKAIKLGPYTLRYESRTFGEPPANGPALVISMHGGGGTAPRVNDAQWRNQVRLYSLKEGIYIAPRAPTDTWNLWHQGHIDPLFDRLIENMIVFEGVDPDRVYLTGYSAGGDGTYQLAPRMSDRFAGAAMMAGHPNETVPDGLRNIPFALHMGGKDKAYRRNALAREWKQKLADLQKDDPDGYTHSVVIREGLGHWMNGLDREGIRWMMKFTRNPRPDRVVWVQDDVKHGRLYWLQVDPDMVEAGDRLVVGRDGNVFTVEASDVNEFELLLHDSMIDFGEPVVVRFKGTVVKEETPERTISAIADSLRSRPDPKTCATAKLSVVLSASDSAVSTP